MFQSLFQYPKNNPENDSTNNSEYNCNYAYKLINLRAK